MLGWHMATKGYFPLVNQGCHQDFKLPGKYDK